jgi:hypothetical protein
MNITNDLAVALIGLKDLIIADYQRKMGADREYGVDFDEGSKYVKVTVKSWSSRSVHCFVEKANGNIWRAASWKSPARNFVRGNIYDQASYADRVSWTGVQ